MREGWSIKAAGEALGVHPNKIPQAYYPALRKVCTLMLLDPRATWEDMNEMMASLSNQRSIDAVSASREDDTRAGKPSHTSSEDMQPQEINRRVLMARGRLPRAVLHPKGITTERTNTQEPAAAST